MGAGSLGVILTADNSNLLARMVQAGTVTEREARRMERSLQFVSDQLRVMNQATRSANDSGAGLAVTAGHLQRVGFQSASAKRELLVLAHELSRGEYSRFGGSLLELAERTNAMELAFSAAGAAIGGGALAVGGFIAAAITGRVEAGRLADSLAATGNAAGLTVGAFDSLAVRAAQVTGSTIGASRESLQSLVATGRILPELIGTATEASLRLQRVSAQTSDEIARDFAKMGDGVARWAAEHNRQAHFASAAQFEVIKALDDAGRAEEAAALTLRLLNGQLAAQTEHLGLAERAWKGFRAAVSAGLEAVKSVGRPVAPADELASLRERLAGAQAGAPGDRYYDAAGQQVAGKSAAVASISARIEQLRELIRLQERAASEAARTARASDKAIDRLMAPPKSTGPATRAGPDARTYQTLLSDIARYNQESDRMAGTARRVAEADRWEIEMKARLGLETEKLTRAQQLGLDAAIDAAAASRRQADETYRAAQLEADLQHLLAERQVGGPVADFATERQIAATRYLRGIGDETRRAEALVNGSFSRMEDAVVAFAKTGKLSFSDLFGFMAEEYLRNLVRMQMQRSLTDAAGNFIGFGGLLSAVGSFLGFAHANGLERVPYDNYPALLHRGERVQTALQAGSGSAGGGGQHFDFSHQVVNIGQGVSRAEVAAALLASQAGLVARIRRSDATGRAL